MTQEEKEDYQADRIYDKRCIDFWCDMYTEKLEVVNSTDTWDSERYYRELNQRVNVELNKKPWL